MPRGVYPRTPEMRANIAKAARGRAKTKKHKRAIGRGVMLAHQRMREAANADGGLKRPTSSAAPAGRRVARRSRQ